MKIYKEIVPFSLSRCCIATCHGVVEYIYVARNINCGCVCKCEKIAGGRLKCCYR